MSAPDGAEDRLRLFLAELAVLREEYGMEVAGCGECGSPWVADVREGEAVGALVAVGRFLAWDGSGYVFRQGSILGGG